VWGVCLSLGTLLGALAGAVVAFLVLASCTGDSMCSSDEGGNYAIAALIMFTVAGLAAGAVLAAVVAARQRSHPPR